jgi:hypothetical protein
MPRKKVIKPLPEHIEEFLLGLEAQVLAGDVPNRDLALQPVEKKLGRLIDIEAELRAHPLAQDRFDLIWRRTRMRVEDAAIGNAAEGKAHAMGVLRGMGGTTAAAGGGSERSENGRLQLTREHRPRVAAARGRW